MKQKQSIQLLTGLLALSLAGNGVLSWFWVRERTTAEEQAAYLAEAQTKQDEQNERITALEEETAALREELELATVPTMAAPGPAPESSLDQAPPKPYYGENGVSIEGSSYRMSAALEAELTGLLTDYGKPKAFFLLGLEDAIEITYQPDKLFAAASTVKGPFALYCYEQIRDGNGSLSETMVYEEWFTVEGTGVLQNEPTGGSYTLRELLYDMLHYSDNVAYLMLLDRFGWDGFNDWLDAAGVESLHLTAQNAWPRVTARDAAKLWRLIYEFDDRRTGLRDELFTTLTGARTNLIQYALPNVKVAHKGGWMLGSYHDMGIVLADEPYVMIVLTESDGEEEDEAFMRSLVRLLDRIMRAAAETI